MTHSFFTSPLGSICQTPSRSYPWGVRLFCLALLSQVHTESIQKCAPQEIGLSAISLWTSGNYIFSAVGYQQKSAKFLTVFIFLCCLAMLMWAVWNPSPTPQFLRTEGKKMSRSGLFSQWDPQGRSKHPRLLPATEDLLISSSGCGRTAGSCSIAPVSSGVRSGAHFTCGWVRISICFASTPHHAAALSLLPSLFTCSGSRHPASALWRGDAHQAAMWFDREQCQGLIQMNEYWYFLTTLICCNYCYRTLCQ